MKRRKTLWAAALCIVNCALCVVSCSSDEQATDQQLPAGKYPLELSAANISVEQTRATANNSFDDGNKVSVKVDGDDNVYTYVVGENSTLKSDAPYYWKNTSDITVTAWYPTSAIDNDGTTVKHSVKTNQSKEEDYIASDFVKADGQTVKFSDENKKLTFTHQVAKIIVNLTFGEGMTEGDKADASVSIHDGTTDATTGAEDYIVPNCSIPGSQYLALIMPTTISAKTDFIKVTVGDGNFVYTLDEDEKAEFEAGKVYTYNITVNKTGIELTGCTIAEWNEEEDEKEHDAKMDLEETIKEKRKAKAKENVKTLNSPSENTKVSGEVTLTGTTQYGITIADGSFVILKDAGITSSSGSAIKCEGNATIYLEGTNTAISTSSSYDTASCGIEAGGEGTTLIIDGDGSLEATGGRNSAAIGCGKSSSCGDITINGGTVTASGGDYGAGIGGAWEQSSCGNITINGGTITAIGGEHTAGIGSGYWKSSCGNISINSGVVTAKGGEYAAGIGNGYNSNCGDISISGGEITAMGGNYGAGIGCGGYGSSNGESKCGDITINGGKVTATGGDYAAAIGSGCINSKCGNIEISGGEVTSEGGKNAVAIGSGCGNSYGKSSCGTITITSGVTTVTVTKGEGATNYIGTSNDTSTCGDISIDDAKDKITYSE